jgi:hypothetical protein
MYLLVSWLGFVAFVWDVVLPRTAASQHRTCYVLSTLVLIFRYMSR